QVGSDREQTLRTLVGIGAHPNVGHTVVVGLGCEGIGADVVAEGIRQRGRSAEAVLIQDTGGMRPTAAEVRGRLAAGADSPPRRPVAWDRLVIGLAGWDRLGPAGAALVEGLRQAGVRLLWATGGQGPRTALPYATPLPAGVQEGWMRETGGEAETLTGLVAAGCQIILAAGDLQHLGGHPVAPVIRLSHDPALKPILGDDLDGWIEDRAVDAWVDYVAAVASGQPTLTETTGAELFAIARVGPTL
ncbi:MAG: UxaA family hydrolase, partial [Thermaerobacter sp.]|nr:UxaA family hydrolase [Thermaerobacter sp.]